MSSARLEPEDRKYSQIYLFFCSRQQKTWADVPWGKCGGGSVSEGAPLPLFWLSCAELHNYHCVWLPNYNVWLGWQWITSPQPTCHLSVWVSVCACVSIHSCHDGDLCWSVTLEVLGCHFASLQQQSREWLLLNLGCYWTVEPLIVEPSVQSYFLLFFFKLNLPRLECYWSSRSASELSDTKTIHSASAITRPWIQSIVESVHSERY